MIPLDCPHCQTRLKVPDTAAGKIVLCPRCRREVSVPAIEDWHESPPRPARSEADLSRYVRDDSDRDSDTDDEDAERRRNRLVWILGSWVIVAALLAAISVIIIHVRGIASPEERAEHAHELGNLLGSTAGLLLGLFLVLLAVGDVVAVFWALVWVGRDTLRRKMECAPWLAIYAIPQFLFQGAAVYAILASFAISFFSAGLALLMVLFGLVLMAFAWSGLVLYRSVRRPGRLRRCRHCGQLRLAYACVCPHCDHRSRP